MFHNGQWVLGVLTWRDRGHCIQITDCTEAPVEDQTGLYTDIPSTWLVPPHTGHWGHPDIIVIHGAANNTKIYMELNWFSGINHGN